MIYKNLKTFAEVLKKYYHLAVDLPSYSKHAKNNIH